MAIARTTRPVVLIGGTVERTAPRRRKADQTTYANEVVLRQESGALVAFIIYDREGSPSVPHVGSYVAAECSVEESREYGTTLNYESTAFDALDLMQSSLAAA